MSRAAVSRPIRATCAHVSAWAVELLAAAGFEARVVSVLTLAAWNATDNGHTFIEVRDGERWVAYDVDRKLRWTDNVGRALSMSEWLALTRSGKYRITPLAGAVDEARIRKQDARWAHVPFVRGADGKQYFPSQGGPDGRILAYSRDYRVLPARVWHARFYTAAIDNWGDTSGRRRYAREPAR